MHGPNHLFCAGCNMDDDPLAAAAWAGHLSAQGNHAEAKKWADIANSRLGRIIIGCPEINVRVIGDGPAVEDINLIIETLKLTRDAYARRSERKKQKEEAATASAGSSGEQSGAGEEAGG